MSEIMGLIVEYWHMAIVAALLVFISIGFLFRFVIPAMRLDEGVMIIENCKTP